MTRYAALCGAGLLVLVLSSATQASTPARARLEYRLGTGAGDCPSRNLLRDAVARRIGYDPFDGQAAERVVVDVAGGGARLEATVRFYDEAGAETGVRVVEAAGAYCVELIDVMALAVSLALDPTAAQRFQRPRRARAVETRAARRGPSAALPSPQEGATTSPGAPADPRPGPTTPAAGLGGALYLDLLAALGAAPAPSAGFLVGGALRGGIWSLGLELRADLPASKEVDGGRVGTHLAVVSLLPCLHFGPIGGCGVVTAGGVLVRGSGPESTGSGQTPYAAAGARATFEWDLLGSLGAGALTVRVSAEVAFPITRTNLHAGERVVWTTPVATGSASLGLGWRFD